MTVRPATPIDAQQIADIWNHYIRDTIATFNPVEKSRGEIVQILADKALEGQPFVVFDQATIQGFATYGAFRGGKGYAKTQEHTILLHPDAIGKGIGRDLLRALERHAKNSDIHSLIAGVSGENAGGIAFHLACGFKQVARLPQVGFKFERWHDLVILQKVLCQDDKG